MVRDLEHRIPFTLNGSVTFLLGGLGYLDEREREGVMEALFAAVAAHGQQRRKSGQLYAMHPIHAAIVCAAVRSDAETVMAALLHDALEDTDLTAEEIGRRFGPEVRRLVEAVTRHRAFSTKETHEKVHARAREDVRVAVLKAADCTVNLMQHGQLIFAPEKHAEHLQETRQFFLGALAVVPGFPSELTRMLERVTAESERDLAQRLKPGHDTLAIAPRYAGYSPE